MLKVVAGGIAVITVAVLTPGGEQPELLLHREADVDLDGMISREEISAIEGLDFERMDTNRDGRLDFNEWNSIWIH